VVITESKTYMFQIPMLGNMPLTIKKTKGSTYGYTSAGGGQASSTPVIPVAYLVPTADGHEYAANPEPEEVEPVEVAPETPGMGGPLTELNDLGVNTGLKLQFFTGVKLQTSGKFF
jgi:hypothetical protein